MVACDQMEVVGMEKPQTKAMTAVGVVCVTAVMNLEGFYFSACLRCSPEHLVCCQHFQPGIYKLKIVLT